MANFVKHTKCDKCGSSDGLAIYDDNSKHCFVCEYTVPSEEYKASNKKEVVKVKESKPVLSEERRNAIKDSTIVSGNDYRLINDEIYKYFGVRHMYSDDNSTVPSAQYYPVTQEGELTGYKIRETPKTFRSEGRTGAECDMFMQFRFKRGGRYVVITEGEIDSLSAYQIFKEYHDSKGQDYETAVVSPTTGANSSRQIANNYKFFDTFEQIIICYDNDKAGKDAIEDVIKVLPKGKVKIMQMRHKDANEYLKAGDSRAFLSDFYNAKSYVPAGVVGSSQLYDRLIEKLHVAKIKLPSFLNKFDDMIGSIELGTIGVIAAGSGAAKTTVANELIYDLIFNSPHKVGVVSLELDAGQYAQAILSRHIEKKISKIKNHEERIEFVQSEGIKSKAKEVFLTEDGSDRFMLIDEREGSIEAIQDTIEELVIACECKLLILDPVSDLFDGLQTSEQESFMKWLKGMVKRYNISFLLISHIRKSSDNKGAASTGAFVPEEAISGSGHIFKSASWVMMMQRDKYHTNDVVRNTTRLILSKNRSNGETGKAGELFYDSETHRLHDFSDFFGKDLDTYIAENCAE